MGKTPDYFKPCFNFTAGLFMCIDVLFIIMHVEKCFTHSLYIW